MADYLDIGKIVSSGYEAGKGISEDIASQDILKQAYAGQTPEEIKDPIKQAATLQSAAGMLQAKGLNSAAYKLQKQAGDLSSAISEQQINQLKVKQAEISYAGQLLQAANNDEDLINIVGETVKDTAARLSVEAILSNPKLDFAAKKSELINMTKTADQQLRAQQIAATASKSTVQEDNIETDNLRQRINAKKVDGLDLSPEEIEWEKTGVLPKYQRAAKARAETTPVGESPKSVRLNNPLNLTDPKTGEIRSFKTYEEGTAAGKADLASKLDGISTAYKAKFGDKPVTPERLAETWAPAAAKGNSPESTANYAKQIAKAANVAVGEKIPNTPEVRDRVFNAMAEFEAGPGSGAKAPIAETADEKLMKQYDEKRGGGLNIKEWDTINPTAVQIGKEYKIKPTNLASATSEEKKSANAAYQVSKLAEDNAAFIKEHPKAVGTLAAIFKSVSGKTGNLADNVSSDKLYTGEVAELGKRLFALGLKDAAASAGGRMNVYLEKSFSNLYDQSQSDRTLLRIIKARQEEAFNVLRDTYGADKENLDKSKYGLAFAPDADAYVTGGKGSAKDETTKPKVSIDTFFKNKPETDSSFSSKLESLGR